jgi:hypothetical protein
MKRGLLIGAVVVGGLILLSRKAKGKGFARPKLGPPPGMKAAPVKAGEKVSAQTFKTLPKRRPGATYVPAKTLPNGLIEFTPTRNGKFTRWVVQQGDGVFAEVV